MFNTFVYSTCLCTVFVDIACAHKWTYLTYLSTCAYIYTIIHLYVVVCCLALCMYVCIMMYIYIYIHIWNYDDDHICRHTLCGHTLCEHALLTVRCAILRLTLIPVSQSRTWGALSMKIYMWNHSMCYYGINMDKPYPNIIGIADISTSGFFLEWFLPVRWRPTAAG
jgi:hypothetical protein